MAIRVALNHYTRYRYDRLVSLSPHIVRLRPAPHSRTPIQAYSLRITPEEYYINWQQDPFGNYQARLVFAKPTREFSIEVDLVAEMTVINPFDFFLESYADNYPFQYEDKLTKELLPYLERVESGPRLLAWLDKVDRRKRRTVDFLVDLNRLLQQDIGYTIRLEPGVQTGEETLTKATGSCRDTAWLLVQILRHLGLAARFVSGYLVQLTADVKSLDGPSGPERDFTDLHAWAEVYVPGGGWIGLDPTSGLFAGEGHIPLACTPDYGNASPITGIIMTDKCETEFYFHNQIKRIYEDPRVTKPYTEEQWQSIEALGHKIDAELQANDVRLTMGGEPTFVSIDDMEGAEWNTAALGPRKRQLAGNLLKRLRQRFGPGGTLQYGQGKWYPGEQLPRWALGCFWRKDGVAIWQDDKWLADEQQQYGYTTADALRFIQQLARRLGIAPSYVVPGYEDTLYYLWKEGQVPPNLQPTQANLKDSMERQRLARLLNQQGLNNPTGYALPLRWNYSALWTTEGFKPWYSCPWEFRSGAMYLTPGDSPMGLRLPLDSLPWVAMEKREIPQERSHFEPHPPLPTAIHSEVEQRYAQWSESSLASEESLTGAESSACCESLPVSEKPSKCCESSPESEESSTTCCSESSAAVKLKLDTPNLTSEGEVVNSVPPQEQSDSPVLPPEIHGEVAQRYAQWTESAPEVTPLPADAIPPMTAIYQEQQIEVIHTALCVEARNGALYIFLPPLTHFEHYLDLVASIEMTAKELNLPIFLEGYEPPYDPRLLSFKITPDPGVIEVNIHPAYSWDDLVKNTTTLYDEAYYSRLGTEKFMLDGRHTGTGGGNHVTLGGPTPADSPILRRPDLLRSLVTYWQHHPSLSYLFSGLFIGPTSQAPRIDEARHESLYELEIAFQRLPEGEVAAPWLVDRLLRHLLVDLTGNTHRAEFCIDKLYSPDSATGRLGLLEMRAFEMPPHARMSLMQMLLLRALIARFWKTPYCHPLVRWGTGLHDRFLLPHFVRQDMKEIVAELQDQGYPFQLDWLAPFFEFRFPHYGTVRVGDIQLELQMAIEPWHVLGEEVVASGTARFVDSSVERLQVKVTGLTDSRYVIACNGRYVPLHNTGTKGEYVAGIRYRAWQPPSALHPTIPVHVPLVFDIIDTWNGRSIGGCTYHVAHPGGLNDATFPINANAAESRRISRFEAFGHTPGVIQPPPEFRTLADFYPQGYPTGPMQPPQEDKNPDYPCTLDLRREREYGKNRGFK